MPIDLNELRKPKIIDNDDTSTNLKAQKLSEFIMQVLAVLSLIVAVFIGYNTSWWFGVIVFFATFGILIFAIEKITGVKM